MVNGRIKVYQLRNRPPKSTIERARNSNPDALFTNQCDHCGFACFRFTIIIVGIAIKPYLSITSWATPSEWQWSFNSFNGWTKWIDGNSSSSISSYVIGRNEFRLTNYIRYNESGAMWWSQPNQFDHLYDTTDGIYTGYSEYSE